MSDKFALPAPALLVIYATDIRRVADFYAATLSLPVVEQEADFVVVGNAAVEVAVVRMPEALARPVQVADPPRARVETPLKGSFLVEDFERVRAAAVAAGGDTKPVSTAWAWRGQLHLDGQDPEGNVVQFRRRG